jgi:hypothetical protein
VPDVSALSIEPQPHAKRTVEGDLGTYVSARHVAALLPEGKRPELPPAMPSTPDQIDAAAALTRVAAVTAMHRHAGVIAHLYTPTGRKTVARGRDLSGCGLIIGTGGALTRLPGGDATLELTRGPSGERLLPPPGARVALDRDYVFACCGALVAHFPPDAAIALMRASTGV